jgi:hypothetical protein
MPAKSAGSEAQSLLRCLLQFQEHLYMFRNSISGHETTVDMTGICLMYDN